ncbi:MAG: DUF285 domain-containing protein, partial [Bacteroidetes bacterium]|nr:DUF285 domain-containing protein [Bacteroidota bacterium]
MKSIFTIILIVGLSLTGFSQNTFKITGGNVNVKETTSIVLNNTQFVNHASFTPDSGQVLVTGIGSDVQSTVGGDSITTFYNLILNKTSNGSLLGNSIQVSNQLNMTKGNFDLNGSNITLGSASGIVVNESGTSYIHGSAGGKVIKTMTLNAPTSLDPGNMGAVISSTANLGTTTVKRGHEVQIVAGGIGGESIERYYDILPTNNTGLAATLRFNYLDHELNGLSESDLSLWRENGGVWENMGYTFRDTVNNYVELSGIDFFSRWTLAKSIACYNDTLLLTSCDSAYTVIDSLTSISDCDSITVSVYTLLPSYNDTIFNNSCIAAGTSVISDTTVAGCDSITTVITVLLTACDSTDYFITTWRTDSTGTSNDSSITIPTFSGETYNYDVDWTYDGITFNVDDGGVTGDITHDYGTSGTYTVAIRGTFPRIYFDDDGDHNKILTIEQWGTNPWTSMENAFDGCENLNITNMSIDTPDLSGMTNMSRMFAYASSFNSNINNWNTSNITNMKKVFIGTSAFNSDISSWDVSNVTNMSHMFQRASVFEGDLSAWNVSNVTNMSYMFSEALLFNSNISNWNTGNVTNMEVMFNKTNSFNQDIGGWNVSKVTNMYIMFSEAIAFNQDIGSWDVSMVTNMPYMFKGATAFDQNIGSWDIGQMTNITEMFVGATLSTANYDALLIGWATDSSGTPGDGIDDIPTTDMYFNGGN